MSWITPTMDLVVDEMSEREVSSLNAVKGREALAGIVQRVVARVRGVVFSSGVDLGEEGTIPDSLAMDAIAIARWSFLISVAKNEALQTADRRTAAENAEDRLAKVASGELKVEPGVASSASSSGPARPSFGSREKHFGAGAEDGI